MPLLYSKAPLNNDSLSGSTKSLPGSAEWKVLTSMDQAVWPASESIDRRVLILEECHNVVSVLLDLSGDVFCSVFCSAFCASSEISVFSDCSNMRLVWCSTGVAISANITITKGRYTLVLAYMLEIE